MIYSTDMLNAYFCACGSLAKSVPEADHAAELVKKILSAHWKERVSAAERALISELDDLQDRSSSSTVDVGDQEGDQGIEALLALFLLLVSRELLATFAPPTQQALRDVSRDLLSRAARGSGEAVLGAGRWPAASTAAVLDLRQIVAGHVALAEPTIREKIRSFLTDKAARAATADVAGTSGRAAWLEEFRAAVDAPGRFLEVASEDWSYRTWNTGKVEAALEAGVALVLLNNPPLGPDSRTTPFCRAIHGRRVDLPRARQLLDSYREALASGDPKAPIQVWDLSRGRNAVTQEAIEAVLNDIPLPPFHFRCRTQAVFE